MAVQHLQYNRGATVADAHIVADEIISTEQIAPTIRYLREQKVRLDFDLAALYGLSTKVLNQAVKRNLSRSPEDFMFRLNVAETRSLRSQIVTLKRGEHLEYPPYAFTEQGVAMLSSVLRSQRAVKVNIAIMRAFVRLREAMEANRELAHKFAPPENAKREIGFHVRETAPRYPARTRRSR